MGGREGEGWARLSSEHRGTQGRLNGSVSIATITTTTTALAASGQKKGEFTGLD